MSIVCKLQGKSRKAFMYFIEASVVVIFIAFIVMGTRTYGTQQPPVTLHEPAIVTSTKLSENHSTREVHIERDVTYNDTTPVILSTELFSENDEIIELPEAKIVADRLGTFKTHRLYYVSRLAPGKWCIKTSIYWTPFLSLRERSYTSPESCFIVDDK